MRHQTNSSRMLSQMQATLRSQVAIPPDMPVGLMFRAKIYRPPDELVRLVTCRVRDMSHATIN